MIKNRHDITQLLHILIDTLEHDNYYQIPLTKGITAKKFAEYTGFTCHALKKHRKSGIHPKNKVWFKDVTGRILYDLEGYNQWQTQTRINHIKKEKQKINLPFQQQLNPNLIK